MDQCFDEVGWPIGKGGWPLESLKNLMLALKKIPGSENLGNGRLCELAKIIEMVSSDGYEKELPRNKTATPDKTEGEIIKLHDLCEKLADHIKGLHQPAVSALINEGLSVISLMEDLRRAQEIAEYACGGDEASNGPTGRPEKIEATEVTKITAKIYSDISGKRPTFTTDPETSEVSGSWPIVLKLVFDALHIDASVSSQVRAQSKKSRAN